MAVLGVGRWEEEEEALPDWRIKWLFWAGTGWIAEGANTGVA